MLNKLMELTNNNLEYAKKAIFYAIDNNYQGFTDGSKLYYKENFKENIFDAGKEEREESYNLAEITKKRLEQEMLKKFGG